MGKVILNEDRCIGCGVYMSIAPENFTFSDEGRAEIINTEITDAACEASEMCPVSAITIENECECNESCSCNCNCGEDCNCDNNCNCGCN